MSNKEETILYLNNQLAQPNNRIRAYVLDEKGKPHPKRREFFLVKEFMESFLQGKEPRWVVIPGLRGVGKTTLLAQIYASFDDNAHRLFISMNEVVPSLGVGLQDILNVYEELIGTRFENLEQPVYLFIDEVQYDKDWAVVLQNIYNRSKKVFIICTGSSALSLQADPNIGRRAYFKKLYPLSFTEYINIKYEKEFDMELGETIKNLLFNSENATQVYDGLQQLQKRITKYWVTVDRLELDKYLQYGTLPFTLNFANEAVIYNQVEQTFTNIRTKDIPQLGRFDQDTLSKIQGLLYVLSSSDVMSLKKLSAAFNVAENTIRDIFEALEKSEVLIRVYPYGSHLAQATKPSKYLFLSSAYRSMFYNIMGSKLSYHDYKGKLLEDIVGLYLQRNFKLESGTSLNYDPVEGGADFITVSLGLKKIAIEVGYGKKNFRQVKKTMKRIPCQYGLSISPAELALSDNKEALLVPLNNFLLI
jgi:uncharacterized protein